MMRLGHCHQRMAALLADPAERVKTANAARDVYEQVRTQFSEHPLRAFAEIERANSIALAGELPLAIEKLTRFGADPFAKALQGRLDARYKQPMHICELTWDLIERGALTFDRAANDHRVVTFHDSCNVARASRMGDAPGGQFEIPRAIIRAVANRYVEMPKGTTREATFCCGGGGGLLTDELLDLRVKGALPRMEALQEVVDRGGVNFMATICAICKAQFTKVLPYYGFKMGMVGGVHQLVSTAIRLGSK
jgi:Fe-S oxidoreductase